MDEKAKKITKYSCPLPPLFPLLRKLNIHLTMKPSETHYLDLCLGYLSLHEIARQQNVPFSLASINFSSVWLSMLT